MKRSRFSESQIVEILKEADAGLPANEVWRKRCCPILRSRHGKRTLRPGKKEAKASSAAICGN